MSDDQTPIENRVAQLTSRLASVEARLAALESRGELPGHLRAATADAVGDAPAGAAETEPTDQTGTVEWFTLVGRMLLVLAGAFLLRALTETGMLPMPFGPLIGLAYALVWVALADRAAIRARPMNATVFGLAASLIAYPLLAEVTVKHHIFPAGGAAAALVLITGVALYSAARHKLHGLAWIVTLGAVGTSIGLAVGVQEPVLFTSCLLLIALGTLWLGFLLGWNMLAGLTAAAVDGMVLLSTAIVLLGEPSQVERLGSPSALIVLQLALCLTYFGSFAARAMTRGNRVSAFDVVQGIVVFLIGAGGAIAVTREYGMNPMAVGAVVIGLATVCYAASFAVIDARERGKFIFYSSFALAAALVGCIALVRGPALVLVFAGSALLAAWLSTVFSRATLSLHGAVYAIAGLATSGMIVAALRAVTDTAPRAASSWVTPWELVALAAAAAYVVMPVATPERTWGRFSKAPKLIVLAGLVIGLGGIVISLGSALLPVGEDNAPGAGALAALRTATFSVSALLLGLLGRNKRFVEAGWLVYPVLILGGIKLLAEDLRAGQASTLFISLAVYGVALVFAPRLVRKKGEPV